MTPEPGERVGFYGAKKYNGSKLHPAADTVGNPLAMQASPANEQHRDHVGPLVVQVHDETGGTVEMVYTDQGYTGEKAAMAAEVEGAELVVVTRNPEGQGFIVFHKRWIVKRRFRPDRPVPTSAAPLQVLESGPLWHACGCVCLCHAATGKSIYLA